MAPRLATSSLIVTLGLVCRHGAVLAAFIGLSRLMNLEEYGAFRRVWLVMTMASAFATIGIPAALQYFMPSVGSLVARRRTALRASTTILVGCMAFAVAVYVFAPQLAVLIGDPSLTPSLRTACWTVPGFALINQSNTILNAAELPRLAAATSAVLGILTATALLFFTHTQETRLGLLVPLIWTTLACGIGVLALLTFCVRAGGNHAQPAPRSLAMLRFGAPIFLAGGILEAGRFAPRAIASSFATAEEFAIFANAAVDIPIASLLVTAVTSVIQPRVARATRHRPEVVLKLIHAATGVTALIVFPSSAFLVAVAPDFIGLLFGDAFRVGAPIFSCFAVAMTTRIFGSIEVLNSLGFARYNLFLGCLTLVLNCTLPLIGHSIAGMVGIAASLGVMGVIWQACALLLLSRALQQPFSTLLPWRYFGKLAMCSMVAFFATLPILNLAIDPLLRMLVCALLFASCYLALCVMLRLLRTNHGPLAPLFCRDELERS